MRLFLATVCAAGWTAMCAAESATPLEALVNRHIERFQLPWTPPAGAMDDVACIIETRALDGAPPISPASYRHSRITAEFLRHLVVDAGGQARFDRPLATSERASQAALAARMAEHAPQAVVLLRYRDGVERESPQSVSVAPLSANAAARRFGERLGELVSAAGLAYAFADETRSAPAFAKQPDALVVVATFPAPTHDAAPPETLRNARWLFEALAATRQADTRQRDEGGAHGATGPAVRRARRIWPFGDLPLERAPWFCDQFAEGGVRAGSLIYFTPRARVSDGVVILEGATSVPALKAGLAAALQAVGVAQVDNRMRLVPDEAKLGDQRFGICRVDEVLTYLRPQGRGGLRTELVRGEAVMLLDATETDYLTLACDGYWGWCPHAAIETCDTATFDRALNSQSASAVTSFAETSVRAAFDLLYAPYVFGGKTALGIDCSGLICNVTRRAGGAPARDAWQQALSGRLVATRWHRSAIRAGDRLYFINAEGHIHHTALAISPTHYIHANPPCVKINSLVPGDRLYHAALDRSFFIAKRP